MTETADIWDFGQFYRPKYHFYRILLSADAKKSYFGRTLVRTSFFSWAHCLCTTQICGTRPSYTHSCTQAPLPLWRFFAFCGVPAAMLTEFTWWLSVC